MPDSHDDLKAREKKHQGESYIWYSDVTALISTDTPSLSSFRRRVDEGVIHTVDVPEQKEAAYRSQDVALFLRGEFSKKRGGAHHTKKPSIATDQFAAKAKSKASTPRTKAQIRLLEKGDVGAVYHMQFDQDQENTIQPGSMQLWIKDGFPAIWVAHNPRNPADIWATISVLPLDEEIIVRFLRGEFSLQEISITDLLPYQRGQSHACYIIATAEPTHKNALVQLMEYLFSYWCDHYPDMGIKNIYASLLYQEENIPLLHLFKTFFFSRRRDISTSREVWELPLNEYSPSRTVENYQKCLKEKSMLVLEMTSDINEQKKSLFAAPLQYREAKTKEDVAALVQIGSDIFIPAGAKPSVSNEHQTNVWFSWLAKNPEIFHVVTSGDEIIGYISMIPLRQEVIDKIMRGAHPTTITPDDVLPFTSEQPLDVYVHIWGTTPRLSPLQKRYASAKMLKELRRTFVEDFAQRGINIRSIYTRSNKKDGIEISQHLGMDELTIPGVTDAPDPADRKYVFRMDAARSTNSIIVAYRQALVQPINYAQ